jgi:DNA repair exonuclease SbcCD nuclease subunit
MRIQYVSDIHLEQYTIQTKEQLNPRQWIEPDPNADVLVLAGDIGNPNKSSYSLFLDWCSKSWPHVIIIAGNHEFYTLSSSNEKLNYYETTNLIRSITSHYTNVHFLDRNRIELKPGVHILGCTLWTDIPQELRKYAVQGLNDFRMIPGITFEAYADHHRNDLEWLTNQLEELSSKGEKCVVVTHHLPTEALISKKYQGHPMNCCFYTELEPLIKRTAPLAWICGHSHTGNLITLESKNMQTTILTLNPCGYPGERVETRNPNAVVVV